MYEAHYAFRDHLVDALERDLVGPGTDNEKITDPPITQYVSGILFPVQHADFDPADDNQNTDDYDEIAVPDPGVALANARNPSSMAITFSVDANAPEIVLTATAALYVPSAETIEDTPIGPEHRGGFELPAYWTRQPLTPDPVTLDVSQPGDTTRDLGANLELFVRTRTPDQDGAISVTAALVNRRSSPKGSLRDADSFFQPQITASGAFVVRRPADVGISDEEIAGYRLLYRDTQTYAVGHGCSATWDIPDGRSAPETIRSTFVPLHDLRVSDSNPELDSDAYSMHRIAYGDKTAALKGFRTLHSGYEKWISDAENTITGLDPEHHDAANRHLGECRTAAARILGGIELLATDDRAWEAFVLTNRAMLTQRSRSDWFFRGRPDPGPTEDESHRWRPFQIGFILMCLAGIDDPDHPDRSITDLLWFPTGGGKTEAYLGLIAFTVCLRRLRNPAHGGGVTAMMRYTLRLLTIQQFERASTLIAALELLRREDPERLGRAPIGIGLYVGGDATPNNLTGASRSLNKLASGALVNKGNPVQLHACSWCGTRLDHRNYWVTNDKTRLITECPDEQCPFSRKASKDQHLPIAQWGLPIYLVDQEIYDRRPTLLIATVDKYAGLPWRERAGTLFNIGTDDPPPELIVQDELHLISGPLGTLTGLYETAVDLLCSDGDARPKVVASTATIRRAGDQAGALFNRKVAQFPPSGLDATDSYFATEAPPSRRASRRYVGVMAPAASHTTLMVRTYAALLHAAHALPGTDETKDPYWTLVGYFNSLRVLGGAKMQVQDDVGDRLELLADGDEPREIVEVELTSRIPSSDIPDRLKQMAVSLPDEGVLDVLLATNMISVGVDVDRLGLMAVMGQPPSTSEYIQATSRVGRRWPGLVVAIYNAHRSRDRSHYESFLAYHSAIYRQVEATSVTPFAPRARDRGIHSVAVALLRALYVDYRPNNGATAVLTNPAAIEAVRAIILQRVGSIDPDAVEATNVELTRFFDSWTDRATADSRLVYSNPQHPEYALLGDAAWTADDPDDPWPTLWSLRDVDQESNLYLV